MFALPVADVKTAEQARQLAIDWQLDDSPKSWGEIADAGDYFAELGEKFNLMDEFRENGIL
jgi:hypothetical protein